MRHRIIGQNHEWQASATTVVSTKKEKRKYSGIGFIDALASSPLSDSLELHAVHTLTTLFYTVQPTFTVLTSEDTIFFSLFIFQSSRSAVKSMASSFRTATAHKSTNSPVFHRHFFNGSRPNKVSFRLYSKPKLRFSSKGLQSGWKCSYLVRAKLNEVADDGSSNAAASTPAKAEVSPEAKDVNPSTDPPALVSEESMSEFITQVARLVKLVNSKDIVELQTKQLDCELYICKKEALPPPPTPVTTTESHTQPAALPSLPTPSPPPIPTSSPAPTPARSEPEVKKSSLSLPPLKCPMAGTFYRSSAPGEPPFVKVGDKVQKGQVVCIVEAMKLMNEIEVDQSGTIVEILAEDGKPVSIDTPLLLIEP